MRREDAITMWSTAAVSDIAQVNPGASLPDREIDESEFPLYEMAAINESNGTLLDPKMVPLKTCRSGKSRFRNGDVLFAKITPCVQNGKSAVVTEVKGDLAFGSSEFYVLRPNREILPEFLFFFVRQRSVIQSAVDSFSGSSGRQRVPPAFWDRLLIPIPPLPVQRRIVDILSKADSIRRKRQDALELADSVLPALFKDMFLSHSDYPRASVGDICEIRGGKRLPAGSQYAPWQTNHRYLRVTDVTNGRIDTPGMRFLSDEVQRKIAKYETVPEDIVISIAGEAGITALIPDHGDETWNLTENMALLRCRQTSALRVLPTYLLWFLRSHSGQEQIRMMAAASTIQKLALFRLASVEVPVARLRDQEMFEQACRQAWYATGEVDQGYSTASTLFDSLLSRAFTGELTAEWESTNADWISEQTAIYSRLPQLTLLALLARRSQGGASVAQLMNHCFLIQTEGVSRSRLYAFAPGQSGPFSEQLVPDLENLREQGLVAVEQTPDEGGKVTIVDAARVDQMLQDLPEDLLLDIETTLESYGGLDAEDLLSVISEKYPAYVKRSRARRR